MSNVEIVPAYGELDEIRRLFGEYVAWLGVDMSFQAYDEELRNLPGKYGEPDGRLYLAKVDGRAAGCVGLRRFDHTRCEMKRLYVRPPFRGFGAGRMLAQRIVDDARSIGYGSMLLDTMSTFTEAVALYLGMGFVEVPPYYHNPYPNIIYLEKQLVL